MRFAAALTLILLLSANFEVRAQSNEGNGVAGEDVPSFSSFREMMGKKGDGGSSGGFFNSLFGDGDKDIGKDGKLIDDLKADTWQPKPIPEGQPPGRELARREAHGNSAVPIPLPRARAFAQTVIRRLLEKAGIAGFDPKVEMVAEDPIWAAAYPDGTVLISIGTLRNLQSEDEFAAILAHEISHILLSHHSSDWFMETQERGLSIFNLVLDVKREIDERRKGQGKTNQWEDIKNRAIAEAIVFGSDLFLDAPFNREQEDEADLLGTDLLIKAGYDPDSMALMLDRMAAQQALDEAEKKKRAELRHDQAAPAEGGLAGLLSATGLMNMASKIGKSLKEELREQFGKSHRKPKERRAAVSRYLTRQYPDLPVIKRSTEKWKALLSETAVVAAMEGYRDAIKARQNLSEQNVPDAIQQARRALNTLNDPAHVLPRSVAAEISAAIGDYKTASEYYDEALAGYLPTTGVFEGLAESLSRSGRTDAAIQAINNGVKDLGDPPQLLPPKIALLRFASPTAKKSNVKIEAAALITRCSVEGFEALTKRCKKAQKGSYSIFSTSLSPAARLQAAKLGPISAPTRTVWVSAMSVNARKGPGTNFPVVASFRQNEKLLVFAEKGKWLRVRGHSGESAWVARWLTKSGRVTAAPTHTKASRPEAEPTTETMPAAAAKAAVGPVSATPVADPVPPAPLASATTPSVSEPTQAAKPAGNAVTRLRQLESLRKSGLITQEEYTKKRQEILDAL